MTSIIIVTGTDTNVGKTVFAAALASALGAYYWKPVQSGLDAGGDASAVAALGVRGDRILPETYRLTEPCSPHLSAELDGIEIDPDRLSLPPTPGTLIVEGAGGVLVPLTRQFLYAELFARWGQRVVVVAGTSLGTINHSLLTIEALRTRSVPIVGVAFNGEANEESEAIIADMGGVKRLGRLPHLAQLTPENLRAAFLAGFNLNDFK